MSLLCAEAEIQGTSFQTSWRCKLHNSILISNGKRTIKQNIKLLKKRPEDIGGDKKLANELIEILETVSDEQAWLIAKAMAGLSINKAIETITTMTG